MPEGHDWLTGSEVALILHVSRTTVNRWADAGKLPFIRTLGGRYGVGHRRYPRTKIEALGTKLTHSGGGAS